MSACCMPIAERPRSTSITSSGRRRGSPSAVWLAELGPEADPIRERPEPSGDFQRLRKLLKHCSADCDREAWVRVLAIIDWEADHSAEGLELAIEWSAGGKKFKGNADVES